jgi:hypothetical protein
MGNMIDAHSAHQTASSLLMDVMAGCRLAVMEQTEV